LAGTPSAISATSRFHLAPLRIERLPGNFLLSKKSAQPAGAVLVLSPS
jgi:hypothetical protein